MQPSEIEGIHWHFWHKRHRSPLYLYILFYYDTLNQRNLGYDYSVKTNGSIVGNIIVRKEEIEALGEREWSKSLEEPGLLLKFMREIERENGKSMEKWRELKKEDFAGKPNAQLLESYSEYLHTVENTGPTIYTPLAVEKQLFENGAKILGEMGRKDAESLLFRPVKSGITLQEEESMLELAVSLKQGGGKEKLEKHVELFSWMKDNGYFMEFHHERHYLDQAASITNPEQKLGEFREKTAAHASEFKELLSAAGKSDRLLLETINHAIFFRSFRTERLTQSSFYIAGLLREIARRVGLQGEKDAVYLLPNEVELSLHKKLDPRKLVEARKNAFVFLTHPKGILVAEGSKALECLEHYEKTLGKEKTAEVKGTVSFKGKAKGKAVIIRKLAELSKVKKGDILVAHSTTPDYVPALKKVSGIVTEEGGILCHAAVVSREMKIPCIVGAKHATAVFKDGDEIELNTETGTVKKSG